MHYVHNMYMYIRKTIVFRLTILLTYSQFYRRCRYTVYILYFLRKLENMIIAWCIFLRFK